MPPQTLIEQIVSDAVLDEAYLWLCERRKRYWHNNDVWTLRWCWPQVKPRLKAELLAGKYRFDALHLIHNSPDHIALWSSRDILVQKAMAIVLTRHLAGALAKTCYHLIGNGGVKVAVRDVLAQLPGHRFVFKTDVLRFYASIDQEILLAQLKQNIDDKGVLDLLWQFMRRRIYDGGLYEDVEQGISLGCPLSPLMAAIYLKPMDDRLAKLGLFYARFMDDWVVLAPTHWKLREAVRVVNQTLGELKVQQHPGKTFIGRISRGFDFLGYRITPAGPSGPAGSTIIQSIERVGQLYEQGADCVRIGQYVRRWWAWVRGGAEAEEVMRNPTWALPATLVSVLGILGVPLALCQPPAQRCTPSPQHGGGADRQQRQAARLGHDLDLAAEGVHVAQGEVIDPRIGAGHQKSRAR